MSSNIKAKENIIPVIAITTPNQTLAQQTTEQPKMDRTYSVIFESAIKATPLLGCSNFSVWKTQILSVFEILGIKEVFIDGSAALSKESDLLVRTLIKNKLEPEVISRVINHMNTDSALLIWKSIINNFASTQAANKEPIWSIFSNITYGKSNIDGFITRMKALLEQMHELELLWTTITTINHCGKPIEPYMVLDHLQNHADNVASAAAVATPQIALLTEESRKCKVGAHNPRAFHPESNCYKLYPHLQPRYSSRSQQGNRSEVNVSSFHSSLDSPFPNFILDSG
ncbi:hypothetical protein MJO28_017195 [Puccinia striiformis f. sp. tritici]|nr:hypothetical protein MJO28_017195 [Puccinia striiformis f. sp. tritici]